MNPVKPHIPAGCVLVVLAKESPEYNPLPAALDRYGAVTTEWELTPDELAILRNGGRVRLTTMTFGEPFQPIALDVVGSDPPILVNATVLEQDGK